jgi:hypothetical protein
MSQTKKAPGGAVTLLRFAWQQLANRLAIRKTFGNIDALGFAERLRKEEDPPQVATLQLVGSDPWTAAGVTLKKGQIFSVLADGAVWLSKPLSVGVAAKTALWCRIGKRGPLRKMISAGSNFEAWADGELEFCLKPPGEWANEDGAFDSAVARPGGSGAIEITVAVWRSAIDLEVQSSMFAFGARGRPTPSGWSYLWRLGEGMIYGSAEDNGTPCIHVRTHGDVGILQYPIEAPLDASATLEWRWRVDKLPSSLPEHIQLTHDYLSMAVEFDNGQDLTYFWSSELPVDTVFKCPLPWWDKRETHWVVRSGRDDLGEWQSEKRNLRADYEQAIGGALPAKIVRVWLIANSVFQRRHGEALFAGIALSAAGKRSMIV